MPHPIILAYKTLLLIIKLKALNIGKYIILFSFSKDRCDPDEEILQREPSGENRIPKRRGSRYPQTQMVPGWCHHQCTDAFTVKTRYIEVKIIELCRW